MLSSSPLANVSQDPIKLQDGEMQSSTEKQKVPNVKRAKAPDAKRFKSPMAPMAMKSPGMRLMLSPNLASPSKTSARSLSPAQKSLSEGSSHRKQKLGSRIWTEFEAIYDGQTIVQAKCIYCHKLFKANQDFGTSGCLRHLKSCEGKSRLSDMLTKLNADNLPSCDDNLRIGNLTKKNVNKSWLS